MSHSDAGAVLLDQRTGRYWMTNDTGAQVLRRLLDGGTVDDAAAELCTAFPDVAPGEAVRDTVDMVGRLRAAGMVSS